MKKRSIILSILIGLVLIAMFLPWAYLWQEVAPDPAVPSTYRPQPGCFLLDLAYGDPWPALSFVLALISLGFALFSAKKAALRVVCGVLLLCSAGACVYEGVANGFDYFTPLTWCIFGTLVLLGLWTLLFFGRKTGKTP